MGYAKFGYFTISLIVLMITLNVQNMKATFDKSFVIKLTGMTNNQHSLFLFVGWAVANEIKTFASFLYLEFIKK